MITYVLYNRGTQAERQMEAYGKGLEAAKVNYELIDADSPRGVSMGEDYDVLARPAVILVRDDGTVDQVWDHLEQFPTVQELAYRSVL